jgi:hypothetical protein
LGAVEAATAEAERHGDRSEPLTALVAEARTMLEQARAAEAERARVAAEEAAAAAAAKAAVEAAEAAKRARLEEQLEAITVRMRNDALMAQQVQAELGVPPAAPQDEETLCVLCLDAPKDHIIAPCGHQCVCGACAEMLKKARHPLCPFCRTPINSTFKVFVV